MRTGAQNVGISNGKSRELMDPLSNPLSWTIILSLSSLASLYGHWQMFLRYIQDIPRIVEVGYYIPYHSIKNYMFYFRPLALPCSSSLR